MHRGPDKIKYRPRTIWWRFQSEHIGGCCRIEPHQEVHCNLWLSSTGSLFFYFPLGSHSLKRLPSAALQWLSVLLLYCCCTTGGYVINKATRTEQKLTSYVLEITFYMDFLFYFFLRKEVQVPFVEAITVAWRVKVLLHVVIWAETCLVCWSFQINAAVVCCWFRTSSGLWIWELANFCYWLVVWATHEISLLQPPYSVLSLAQNL